MDIYCRNGKCLICGSKMPSPFLGIINHRIFEFYSCENGCYTCNFLVNPPYKGKSHTGVEIRIFDNSFKVANSIPRKKKKKLNVKKRIIEKVNFYKEDYRYLAEILERM